MLIEKKEDSISTLGICSIIAVFLTNISQLPALVNMEATQYLSYPVWIIMFLICGFYVCYRHEVRVSKQVGALIALFVAAIMEYFYSKEHADKWFSDILKSVEDNTVCKFTDMLFCSYIFLKLPLSENTVLMIGPFLTEDVTSNQIYEYAEKSVMNFENIRHMENYYNSVPVISEQSRLLTVLDTFAEHIWHGPKNYSVANINLSYTENIEPLSFTNKAEEIDSSIDAHLIEQRYDYENSMMRAVSLGQTEKLEHIMQNISSIRFNQRLTDTLRNSKNYCIIMNTLLRKAAESGGVHPIYLDRVSTEYAKKIELVENTGEISELMKKMLRSYCELVREYSIKQYSESVQRVILCINSDLTADLGLNALAKKLNLSAGYLSGLFKKQTGKTLSEYVAIQRVEYAKELLKNTSLQVQTVAQHCGILDVQYFSKIFKRYSGKTPNKYRKG